MHGLLQFRPLSGSCASARIELVTGVGRTNETTNTCQSQDDPPDFSLPLYAPQTKKLAYESTMECINKYSSATDLEKRTAAKWLGSEEWHRNVLRKIPKGERTQFFRNDVPVGDLETMIGSGIIEEVSEFSHGTSQSFCRLTSTNERGKNRRRVLIEPRDLNKVVKNNRHLVGKTSLPTVEEIQDFSSAGTEVEAIDFRSFYYQIQLHESVRRYYRIRVGDRLFQCCVLPMGACHSCFIAQMLSCAIALELRQQWTGEEGYEKYPVATATYIDNIFFFLNEQQASWRSLEISSATAEIGTHERGTRMTILGQIIDLEEKTVSLTEKTREKIATLPANPDHQWSARTIFRCFGVMFFAASVLHLPLCQHFWALRILAKTCREFISGRTDIEDIVTLDHWERLAIRGLIEHAKKWKTTSLFSLAGEKKKKYVFTDASNYGSGAVIFENDKTTVVSEEGASGWLDWHINVKEAEALYRAISLLSEESTGCDVYILSDSKVVVGALLKGHSLSQELNRSIEKIMAIAGRKKFSLFIKWIPSRLNLADGPSRGETEQDAPQMDAADTLPLEFTRVWWHM